MTAWRGPGGWVTHVPQSSPSSFQQHQRVLGWRAAAGSQALQLQHPVVLGRGITPR